MGTERAERQAAAIASESTQRADAHTRDECRFAGSISLMVLQATWRAVLADQISAFFQLIFSSLGLRLVRDDHDKLCVAGADVGTGSSLSPESPFLRPLRPPPTFDGDSPRHARIGPTRQRCNSRDHIALRISPIITEPPPVALDDAVADLFQPDILQN